MSCSTGMLLRCCCSFERCVCERTEVKNFEVGFGIDLGLDTRLDTDCKDKVGDELTWRGDEESDVSLRTRVKERGEIGVWADLSELRHCSFDGMSDGR